MWLHDLHNRCLPTSVRLARGAARPLAESTHAEAAKAFHAGFRAKMTERLIPALHPRCNRIRLFPVVGVLTPGWERRGKLIPLCAPLTHTTGVLIYKSKLIRVCTLSLSMVLWASLPAAGHRTLAVRFPRRVTAASPTPCRPESPQKGDQASASTAPSQAGLRKLHKTLTR